MSGFVSLAARRAVEGQRARAEAEALARLAGSSPAATVLDTLVRVLGLQGAAVLHRSEDGWRIDVAAGDRVPGSPEAAAMTIDLDPDHVLAITGPPLRSEACWTHSRGSWQHPSTEGSPGLLELGHGEERLRLDQDLLLDLSVGGVLRVECRVGRVAGPEEGVLGGAEPAPQRVVDVLGCRAGGLRASGHGSGPPSGPESVDSASSSASVTNRSLTVRAASRFSFCSAKCALRRRVPARRPHRRTAATTRRRGARSMRGSAFHSSSRVRRRLAPPASRSSPRSARASATSFSLDPWPRRPSGRARHDETSAGLDHRTERLEPRAPAK